VAGTFRLDRHEREHRNSVDRHEREHRNSVGRHRVGPGQARVPSAASSMATTCTLAFTGTERTCAAPPGATSVETTAVGAPGGSTGAEAGGYGATGTADVGVPAGPSTLLVVLVWRGTIHAGANFLI
jgi:hypothetical protein